MKRRGFLSTSLVGLVGATAGCTDDNDLYQPGDNSRSEPRDSPGNRNGGDIESGVVETGELGSRNSMEDRFFEYSVDYSKRIRETTEVSLVVFPALNLLDVEDPSIDDLGDYHILHSDVYDGEALSNREISVDRDYEYTHNPDELVEPLEPWTTYTYGLIVDMESEPEPRLLDTSEYSFYAYEDLDSHEKTVRVRTTSKKEFYDFGDHYELLIFAGIDSHETREDALPNFFMHSTHATIDAEELEVVEYIQDPDSAQSTMNFLEFNDDIWVSRYNTSVNYLNRPIVKEIANGLQEAFDEINVTKDEVKINTVEFYVSSCDYVQEWDTMAESASVNYPELFYRNGYGDCKDMGLLANALLHHLGFDTTIFIYASPEGIFNHMSGGVDAELLPETQQRFDEGVYSQADTAGEDGEDGIDFYPVDPSFSSAFRTSSHSAMQSWLTVPGK